MITSFSLKNFKSYREAGMPLATLTFFIGPNASGKSNALEAIRLLSWLAKGSRLDDIERSIQGADSILRGHPANLFLIDEEGFEIGCQILTVWRDWRLYSKSSSMALVALSVEIALNRQAVLRRGI